MCAVWKWHLLYLIILQASAVTKVLWFLFSLQRLRLIEIYDVKRLQLRYATSLIGWGSRDHCFSWFSLFESTFESILSDTLIHCYSFTSTIQHNYTGLCGVTDHSLIYLFSGPSTLATFAAVYALFGPTFPGIYDKERGIYTLFYPVRHDKLLWLFFSLFIFFSFSPSVGEFALLTSFCRVYPLHSLSPANTQICSQMGKVFYSTASFNC